MLLLSILILSYSYIFLRLNLLQRLFAKRNIGGAHYNVGHIAFGKGIHIFDSHFGCSELLEDFAQCACLVGTMETYHIGEHYGKVGSTKYLHGLVHIRHDEA